MVAIKDLKAGQELSCHYMIDMEEAADESIRYHPYITYHLKGDRGGEGANKSKKAGVCCGPCNPSKWEF